MKLQAVIEPLVRLGLKVLDRAWRIGLGVVATKKAYRDDPALFEFDRGSLVGPRKRLGR